MCSKLLTAFYEVDHIQALWRGGDNSVSNLQALCRECHARKGADEKREEQDLQRAQLVFERFFTQAPPGFCTPYTLVMHTLQRHGGLSDGDVKLLKLQCSQSKMQFPAFLWSDSVRRVGCAECWSDVGVSGVKLRPEALALVETEVKMAQLKAAEREKKARVASAFDQFRYTPTKRA